MPHVYNELGVDLFRLLYKTRVSSLSSRLFIKLLSDACMVVYVSGCARMRVHLLYDASCVLCVQ